MQMIKQRASVGQAQSRKAAVVGQTNSSSPPIIRGSSRCRQTVATRQHAELLINSVQTHASAVLEAPPAIQAPQSDLDILPLMWEANAEVFGDLPALEDPHRVPGEKIVISHKELAEQMKQVAAGMQAAGLQQGDRVSLFAENSSRWIVSDQAIMMNGGVPAVRGSSGPLAELAYIARHSDSQAIVFQDLAALKKFAPELQKSDYPALKFIMVMWTTEDAIKATLKAHELESLRVLTFEQVLAMGEGKDFKVVRSSPDDVCTLCYTSGTTGNPKAVQLTHANLIYQVRNLRYFIPIMKGETVLSLLPPWHIYERSGEYFMLGHGLRIVYTTIPKFGQDLAKYKPNHFVCVPLVLDTLYSRVMTKLKAMPGIKGKIATTLVAASILYVKKKRVADGLAIQYATKESARSFGTLVMAMIVTVLLEPLYRLAQKMVFGKVRDAVGVQDNIVCGGGALTPHLDDFFEALGVRILNGWGLTEASPVLACRRAFPGWNIRGSTGVPIPGTSLRVVDPDTLMDVPDGVKGLIIAKGPGVMKGYSKDAESTAQAFRAGPGWFDTGDLGFKVAKGFPGCEKMAGHYVLTGRAKDTIVMSTGKNVEPEPIENKIMCSNIIKHIIIVGQDKRELAAMVFPDFEALDALAMAESDGAPGLNQDVVTESTEFIHSPHSPEELTEMFKKEVAQLNKKRGDYHSYENIVNIKVMSTPLSAENGTLTRTMKPRRPEIYKVYAKEVEALTSKLR